MALPVNSNFSMLPWYSNTRYQNHRKPWQQGQVWPLIARTKRMPPFQVYREHPVTPKPLTQLDLVEVSVSTNGKTTILSTISILAEANAAGLTILEFPTSGYDLIVYPGITAMATALALQGTYYCIMSDSTDGDGETWYSEVFCIKSDVSKYLKLSFWHDVGLAVPGHHISYADPFSNFIYLESDICKPEYPNKPEINDVDGFPYVLYQVSSKVFRFNALLPEYAVDLLRIAEHHYHISITYNGLTYNVLWLNAIPGEWLPQGNLLPVEFKFLQDTIVATTGKLKPEGEGFAYDQTGYSEGFS